MGVAGSCGRTTGDWRVVVWMLVTQRGDEGDRIGDSQCCVVIWVLLVVITRLVTGVL